MKNSTRTRRTATRWHATVAFLIIIARGGASAAGGEPVTVTGTFLNPTDWAEVHGHDPAPLHALMGQNYAGLGSSEFNFDVPLVPNASGVYNYTLSPDGHVWSNHEGVYGTTRTGEPIMMTPEDVASGRYAILPDPSVLREYGSALRFSSPGIADPVRGEQLVLGHLEFQNGWQLAYDPITSVHLQINTASSGESLFNQTLDLRVALDSTSNRTGTREGDADYFYFPDYPEFGSFRVFENESSTIEILGSFNSLHFEGFGNVLEGSGFLNRSVHDPLAVPEAGNVLALLSLSLPVLIVRRSWAGRGLPGGRRSGP